MRYTQKSKTPIKTHTKSKPSSTTQTKATAQPKGKPRSTSSSAITKLETSATPDLIIEDTPSDVNGRTIPILSKSLVLKIIIAKLEGSKNADWYGLSQQLSGKSSQNAEKDEEEGSKGKGKKGNNKSKGKSGGKGKKEVSEDGYVLTGTQLHDMYHHTILPALKAGRALWVDELIPEELDSAGNNSEEEGPVTPGKEDDGMDGTHIVEEVDNERFSTPFLNEEDEVEEDEQGVEKVKKGKASAKTYGGRGGRKAAGGVKRYIEELDDEVLSETDTF